MAVVHRSRGAVRKNAALLLVLSLCLGALSVPAGAWADELEGHNSFNELSEKAQQQETTPAETTPAKTSESESHTSSKTVLIALGAAGLVLGGIAFVIVRDARRVAPAGAEDVGEGRRGQDPAVRRRNRRAKARAARAQRKTQRKKNR